MEQSKTFEDNVLKPLLKIANYYCDEPRYGDIVYEKGQYGAADINEDFYVVDFFGNTEESIIKDLMFCIIRCIWDSKTKLLRKVFGDG